MNKTEAGLPRGSGGLIILVRHGETVWSRTGQHTGTTDLALTSLGEEQAVAVGKALRGPFDLALTSSRQRAWRTAELAVIGMSVLIDDALTEWDYGAYEGMTTEQIADKTDGAWNIWTDGVQAGVTPGERPEEIRRRAESVLTRVGPHVERGGRVLLFSHSHFLRVLTAAWLGLPTDAGSKFSLGTGSISSLGFEHSRHVIATWNLVPDLAHATAHPRGASR